MERGCSDKEISTTEAFLVECLALGILHAYGIDGPPVPVREMIQQPLPVFERLRLLELNLGLYDAIYKAGLDGSRVIVVDLARPPVFQRVGMARALYVAFCCSPRAAELHWPCSDQPHGRSDLFARRLLMPTAWVQQARREVESSEDLATRFDVPIDTVVCRLSEIDRYATNMTVNPGMHSDPGSRHVVAELLTRALFSLQEPWQERFLDLVANMATNWAWGEQRPTQGEVTTWLGADVSLYRDVKLLLDMWQRPGKFYYMHQWKFDINIRRGETLLRPMGQA